MDDRKFDALARALGGAATRRSALGLLAAAGLLAAGIPPGADAGPQGPRGDGPAAAKGKRKKQRKKKRRLCLRSCSGNFACVKFECVCKSALCDGACCDAGKVCQRGACVSPGELCHAQGEACGDGTPCCAGMQCGSGYGGGPVACRPEPGGRCVVNEDCAYGQHCENGACVLDPPPPPPPDDGGGGGGTTCGVVAVTPDAAANGKALQDAVAAARSGDTLKLAAGEYRFENASGATNGFLGLSGLSVDRKTLTIERCSPDAVVTFMCPDTLTGSAGGMSCVLVEGLTGSAALTLRGISVEVSTKATEQVPRYGVLAYANAAIALEDVAVQVSGAADCGIHARPTYADLSTPKPVVTIRSGVSVKSTATVASYYGLYNYNGDGSVTCDAAVSFLGAFSTTIYDIRSCHFVTDPNCGCTG